MASRYWVGPHLGTWATAANWSATSGGAGGAGIPTSTDDVIFDNNSGTGTSRIGSAIAILSLTITSGYTGTIDHSAVVTLTGNVTLGANYTIIGAAGMVFNGSGTYTSNGKAWPNTLTFQTASSVKTFADDWSIGGAMTNSANGSVTYNGGTVTLLNSLSVSNTADAMLGTTVFVLKGGTLGGNGAIRCRLDLDGNIAIGGSSLDLNTGAILNYVSGTVTHSGTIILNNAVTLNTGPVIFDNIQIASSAGASITLNSNFIATNVSLTSAFFVSFLGTAGFTFNNLSSPGIVSAVALTLTAGNNYRVKNSLDLSYSRRGSKMIVTSSHATNKVSFVIDNGATMALLADLTRIDASGGRTLNSFAGTITDCINCQSFTDLLTISRPFL